MNLHNKNFWIAVFSGAALSLLVSNLPFIGFINCLLCGGFWGSAIFAVWLYRRLNGSVTMGEAIRVGLWAGLVAGLLGFALSFVGLAGAQGFLNSAQEFLPADATQGMEDIPAWGAWIFNGLGVIFEVAFGALGGWIGGVLFDPNRKTKKE
jgi:hypothetical protein